MRSVRTFRPLISWGPLSSSLTNISPCYSLQSSKALSRLLKEVEESWITSARSASDLSGRAQTQTRVSSLQGQYQTGPSTACSLRCTRPGSAPSSPARAPPPKRRRPSVEPGFRALTIVVAVARSEVAQPAPHGESGRYKQGGRGSRDTCWARPPPPNSWAPGPGVPATGKHCASPPRDAPPRVCARGPPARPVSLRRDRRESGSRWPG